MLVRRLFFISFLVASAPLAQVVQSHLGSDEDGLGHQVCAVGDFDGDGVPDLVASANQVGKPDGPGEIGGYVEIRSGSSGGAVLFRVTGDDHEALSGLATTAFGDCVTPAGDLDGDGFTDLLVAHGRTDSAGVFRKVAAIAAAPGQPPRLLFEVSDPRILYPAVPTDFGRSLVSIGDVYGANGAGGQDGVPDFAVASPVSTLQGPGIPTIQGVVYLYSGANPTTYAAFHIGAAVRDEYGRGLEALGDLDGDGFPEFAVSAHGGGLRPGYVDVFDGATRMPRERLMASEPSELFGAAIASAGDVNGDGRQELAVGVPRADVGSVDDGRVDLFSLGATGGSAVLLGSAQLPPGHPGGAWFGESLATFPRDPLTGLPLLDVDHDGAPDPFLDVNRDGRPDLVVGAPRYDLPDGGGGVAGGGAFFLCYAAPGGVPAVSPAYNQGPPAASYAPFQVFPAADGERFARHLAVLGSAVGDSRVRIAVGTPGDEAGRGSVQVLRTSALAMSEPTLSLSGAVAGDVRRIEIDAGPRWAGNAYLVLGSTAGTFPGVLAAGRPLPLNWDGPTGLFRDTLLDPNQGHFAGNLGLLDASGRGAAELQVSGPLDPAHPYAQGDHHYAFLTFGPGGPSPMTLLDVSDAVRLRILP